MPCEANEPYVSIYEMIITKSRKEDYTHIHMLNFIGSCQVACTNLVRFEMVLDGSKRLDRTMHIFENADCTSNKDTVPWVLPEEDHIRY